MALVFALFWGCDLFSTRYFEPKPATLHPEDDAFASQDKKVFLWKEGVRKTPTDSLQTLGFWTLEVHDSGKIGVGPQAKRKLGFISREPIALPVGVVSGLGFQISRLIWDSAAIADPGPDLTFPEHPVLGWKIQKNVGLFHIDRELLRVDTLDQPEGLMEAWVFAEWTYWGSQVVASSTYWIGNRGLIKMHAKWPHFPDPFGPGYTELWRETTAL